MEHSIVAMDERTNTQDVHRQEVSWQHFIGCWGFPRSNGIATQTRDCKDTTVKLLDELD